MIPIPATPVKTPPKYISPYSLAMNPGIYEQIENNTDTDIINNALGLINVLSITTKIQIIPIPITRAPNEYVLNNQIGIGCIPVIKLENVHNPDVKLNSEKKRLFREE
jgi:hypothetical protein